MAIDASVQHNRGFLPGIILLTQCYYYHGGTRLNVMKRFCICSLRSHLNVLTVFHRVGECSEGLEAFRFFFEVHTYSAHKHRQQQQQNVFVLFSSGVPAWRLM